MTKPEAYPFLRIAKEFGVDYGDVLIAADYSLHSRHHHDTSRAVNALPIAALHEIGGAAIEQKRIRRGEIDWQTGENVVPPEPEAPCVVGNQAGYYP